MINPSFRKIAFQQGVAAKGQMHEKRVSNFGEAAGMVQNRKRSKESSKNTSISYKNSLTNELSFKPKLEEP